ncbi:MAG: single-stranded DNA-binding protein [Pricia sp.]
MSGTLNKVMLIGNLGDEVKVHYFEGGDCIGRFPIATSETYTNKKTGERTTNTEWHNIVVRNKAAEICEKYLGKGDKVYVEGRLRTRQWQDDSGVTRYSTEVQAQDFTFLTTKSESNANPQQGTSSENAKSDATESGSANSGSDKTSAQSKKTSALGPSEEDDLPF